MIPESHKTGLVPAGRSTPLAPVPAPGWDGFAGAAPNDEQAGRSLWALVNDRLRGRWRMAILLAAVLGLGLAVLGYRSTEPKYESVGAIRVVSTPSVTLEGIPEGELVNFGMFLNTQVERLKSRRLLENALEDERLRSVEWESENGRIRELEEDLVVAGDRNSELVYVQYASPSPVTAQAVVNAVIDSYDEIYIKTGVTSMTRTVGELEKIETSLRQDFVRVRADIKAIIDRHNMDPAEMQRMKLEQLDRIEQLVFAADRARRTAAEVDAAEPETTASSATPQVVGRLEQIDPEFGLRRRERDEKLERFEQIALQYRESASAYRIARRDAETAQRLFETQYERALAKWEESRLSGNVTSTDYSGWPRQALEDEIAALEERRVAITNETKTLAGDIQRLQDLREQEQQLKTQLERTKQRIEGLNREEANVASRINVEQWGYRPSEPSSDGRLKRAAVGVVLGCGLSFGLFFLLGTVDRRAYSMDQLEHGLEAGLPPVLGVLPDLRGALDPEASDVAAHCVHQIRNQVEARRVSAEGEGYVLVVSSPFQGDGKTSIVLSLGWSYAVAGYKCLVVDCDLVGRSLTRQLGMSGREGLKESIVAGTAGERIAALPVENLDALPVGSDPRFGPEAVRRDEIAAVLHDLRGRYDMVIVDTGPLLGALEATPVAAVADGVVLSVRRGRSRSRLEDSVARLAAVGGRCLGVILNCAARADCYRSVSEASLSVEDRPRSPRRTSSDSIVPDGNPLVVAMEQTTGEHAYTER